MPRWQMSWRDNMSEEKETVDLPVKQGDDFIGELETMNLDELKDKTFIVSVSTGDRDKAKFICSTLHGPYDFYEMIDEVGNMWTEHQHHAKAYVLEKDKTKPCKWLDKNTIDYIEAHFQEIISEGVLFDDYFDEKEYTCKAGIVEASKEEDPRHESESNEDTTEQD